MWKVVTSPLAVAGFDSGRSASYKSAPLACLSRCDVTDSFDPKLFDKRVAQRYIKKGVLSEKDFEKHLKSLPDLAEKAAQVEATIEPMQVGAGGSYPEEE